MKNLISTENEKLNVKPSKKTIMKTELKKTKSCFETNLKKLLNSNNISVEILKYKSFRIIKSPTKKLPEMVTISGCNPTFKSFLGKKFINLEKVKIFIDYNLSEERIKGGKLRVTGELLSIGLVTNW